MDEIRLTSVEDLYMALRDHVAWLARTRANYGNVMLQPSELEGELSLEIVKGWNFYNDKCRDSGELITVVKRMLDNRLAELKYRFLVTHRRAEMYMLDSDELLETTQGASLEAYMDSIHRVNGFLHVLTPYESDVVKALLCPDDRMRQQVRLLECRKAFVYKNPKLREVRNVVAEALHLDRSVLRHVWATIQRKWTGNERSKMDKLIKDIARERGKQVLLALATELEMEVDAATHIYELVIALRNDLEQNGVPEDTAAVTDDLFWLLVDLGFIDDDGKILEPDDEPTSELVEEPEEVKLPDELPGCWATADRDDPSCKRCKLLDVCFAQRMDARESLACFGRLYDEKDDSCSICLEWRDCKAKTVE